MTAATRLMFAGFLATAVGFGPARVGLARPIHEATASCCSDGDVAVPD